nr:unnamed protein product [Digitaria exilis]
MHLVMEVHKAVETATRGAPEQDRPPTPIALAPRDAPRQSSTCTSTVERQVGAHGDETDDGAVNSGCSQLPKGGRRWPSGRIAASASCRRKEGRWPPGQLGRVAREPVGSVSAARHGREVEGSRGGAGQHGEVRLPAGVVERMEARMSGGIKQGDVARRARRRVGEEGDGGNGAVEKKGDG